VVSVQYATIVPMTDADMLVTTSLATYTPLLPLAAHSSTSWFGRYRFSVSLLRRSCSRLRSHLTERG
jgi:hypothetical protein